jgi:hypothetical protein
MKTDFEQHLGAAASREKRDVWDQFQQDRELIERLSITPQELDSLGKCALLGTLTCKQDFLFILRQIREATGPGAAPTVFASAPVITREDPVEAPDLVRIRTRLTPSADAVSHPDSLAGIVRRRVPEQFGVAFWSIILVAGLVWNLAIASSRWHLSLQFKLLGTPMASQAPTSQAWYSRVDDFKILVGWEIFFVVAVSTVIFLISRRRPRRLKVKPM